MIFEDTITIKAPATKVWDFLLDPDCLAACMPGVENVTRIDDRTFDAAIAARVGPISGKFSFRAKIVEAKPPTEMTADIDGIDSVTKSALRAKMAMTLEPVGPEETTLAYRATVDIKGRLAIVGEMVLRTTATMILEECTRRLREQLEASEART